MPNSPELLTEIATRHQFHIDRYKSGVYNQYKPFLKDMVKLLRVKLNQEDITEFTRARLEKLIKGINQDLVIIQKGYIDDELIPSSLALAKYESEFEIKSLNQAVKYDFVIPNESQLKSAVLTNPLNVKGYDGKLLMPFIDDLSKKSINDITNAIRIGAYQGMTSQQIIKGLTDFNGQLARLDGATERIVKTGLQHVASQARHETWKKNSKVVKGYKIVVTFDGRTSDICIGYGSTPEKVYDVDSGILPPFHILCLSGDTNISTSSGISNVYKRAYKGPMIKITTKSGRVIKITPNHPVLTGAGWKPAKDINISDQVACIDRPLFIAHDKNAVISKFSNIFSSLDVPINSGLVRVSPVSSKDFHGDISDSKVKIIKTDSFSDSEIKAFIDKNIPDDRFIFGKFINFSFHRFSSFCFSINTYVTSNCSFMTGSNLIGSLFRRFKRPFDSFLFTLSSYFDTILFKNSGDYIVGNSKLIPDSTKTNSVNIEVNDFCSPFVGNNESPSLSNGDPVGSKYVSDTLNTNAYGFGDGSDIHQFNGIELDDIVDVILFEYNGHVYNLENKLNWYCSNDIITHNCRTTSQAALDERFSFLREGATRSARDANGKVISVPADESYYGWLNRQPEKYQDSIIGKTRGKLLRDGGLSEQRFAELQLNKKSMPLETITRDGKKITPLMQMREMEPLAFGRAEI